MANDIVVAETAGARPNTEKPELLQCRRGSLPPSPRPLLLSLLPFPSLTPPLSRTSTRFITFSTPNCNKCRLTIPSGDYSFIMSSRRTFLACFVATVLPRGMCGIGPIGTALARGARFSLAADGGGKFPSDDSTGEGVAGEGNVTGGGGRETDRRERGNVSREKRGEVK